MTLRTVIVSSRSSVHLPSPISHPHPNQPLPHPPSPIQKSTTGRVRAFTLEAKGEGTCGACGRRTRGGGRIGLGLLAGLASVRVRGG